MGTSIYLHPKILFEFANWTIKAESFPHLDRIADFLIRNDSLVVEIGIHSDSRWAKAYSMRPDSKRAESIMEYLIQKGVGLNQLKAKGYSEN